MRERETTERDREIYSDRGEKALEKVGNFKGGADDYLGGSAPRLASLRHEGGKRKKHKADVTSRTMQNCKN